MKKNLNKAKRKVILCRGIQCSGKTTFTEQWVKEDPEHRIRFNNDDIRNMLGNYLIPSREAFIKDLKNIFLWEGMAFGFDIIIDDINLNEEEIDFYKRGVEDWNKTNYPLTRPTYTVEFKDFFIPLQVCIDRNSKMEHPIGEKVIRETYEKYKDIIEDSMFNSIQEN